MKLPSKPTRLKRRLKHRRGAITMLAGAVFFVLTVLAGLTINLAYMEMVRTEQRLATDAAAKASLVVLGQTQSRSLAAQAGQSIAALHRVAGRPVAIQTQDIEFGMATLRPNGTYQFTPVQTDSTMVLNSIRVKTSLDHIHNGGIPLIMTPQLFGNSSFSNEQEAIATRIEMDVCLVVDRSGSMAWSQGNKAFEYPGELQGRSPLQNYFALPHPTLSRWAALRSSVDVFVNVLNEAPIKSRVAMASYSSNFTFGIWTSVVASIDQPLTLQYTNLAERLDDIAKSPLIGNTNIAAGLREGINALTDPSTTRVTTNKCIILLTDGLKTQGDDPVELANMARNMNIRVHTIAYSEQADQALMEAVAQAGGGQFYFAPDTASLTQAFRTIAATLPNMLIH